MNEADKIAFLLNCFSVFALVVSGYKAHRLSSGWLRWAIAGLVAILFGVLIPFLSV